MRVTCPVVPSYEPPRPEWRGRGYEYANSLRLSSHSAPLVTVPRLSQRPGRQSSSGRQCSRRSPGLRGDAVRSARWRNVVVRPEGIEPPAYRFEACRSIHLSYGRNHGVGASVADLYRLYWRHLGDETIALGRVRGSALRPACCWPSLGPVRQPSVPTTILLVRPDAETVVRPPVRGA
jgi:hypothetical protein